MLNSSGIAKTTGMTPKQILGNVELQASVGVVVNKSAGTNGIVKAGTPLTGNLDARTTAFTKAATAEGASNAVGVLLHDVDVSKGNNNGTLLLFGFVDKNKLDTTVTSLITAEVQKALPMIKFIKY